MLVLFALAYSNWLGTQTAAFALVCLLWPTASVMVKRLHDRGRSGLWALLIILAWMLVAGNWSMLPSILPWVVGKLIPASKMPTSRPLLSKGRSEIRLNSPPVR